jgi:hypothetical protein
VPRPHASAVRLKRLLCPCCPRLPTPAPAPAPRCHLDASQRDTFLQLAAECAVAPHCVALAMPAKECAARVAARIDHPGGVQVHFVGRTFCAGDGFLCRAVPVHTIVCRV